MTIKVSLHGLTKFVTDLYYKNSAFLIALALVTIAIFILVIVIYYCYEDSNKYVENPCFGVGCFCTGVIAMLISIRFLAEDPSNIFQMSSYQSGSPIDLITAKSLQIDRVGVDPNTSNLIWNYPNDWRTYQKAPSFILAKAEYNGGSTIKLKPIDNTGRAYLIVANYLKRTIGINDQVKLNVELTKTVATVNSSSGRKRIICYANGKKVNSKAKDVVLKLKEN